MFAMSTIRRPTDQWILHHERRESELHAATPMPVRSPESFNYDSGESRRSGCIVLNAMRKPPGRVGEIRERPDC
jgi:hypothetical protein